MTKKIFMVLITQNTGAYPYYLAAELEIAARTSGRFTQVHRTSPYASIHSMLLTALGRPDTTFDTDCLAQQMPWTKADEQGEARCKYATAFIEGCEGMEIGIDQNVFLYHLKGELKRIFDAAPDDSVLLFIVSDVRGEALFNSLRSPGTCHNFVSVRALESKSARAAIKCSDLDNSYLESHAAACQESQFHFDMNPKSAPAQLQALKERVCALPNS